MKDCHANLLVELTAPSAFPAFVQHAATPSIPSQFSSRVEPPLGGMGIFSEFLLRTALELGNSIAPRTGNQGEDVCVGGAP